MSSIPTEEKIEKIDERIAQLKAQKQAIMAREKEKTRKQRTRRLIENGALAEKYLQCEGMEAKAFQEVLHKLVNNPNFSDLLNEAKK